MALVPTQYQQQTPQGNILGAGDSDDDPGYLSESSGELQNNARLVQYPADWQPALIREADLDIIIAFIESNTTQNAAPKPQSTDTPDQEQVLLKEGGDDQPGADNIDITAASVQQSDQGDIEQSLQNRPPSASDDPHPVEDTEETQEVAKASTSSNAQPMTPTKETSNLHKRDTPRGKKNLTRRWKEHQTLKTSSSSDSDTEARRHELRKYQQESLAIGGRATMEEFLVLQQDLEQYYAGLKFTEGGDGHVPEVGPSGEQQPVAASQGNQRSQATDLATADVPQAERDESSASTDTRQPKETCEPVVREQNCNEVAARQQILMLEQHDRLPCRRAKVTDIGHSLSSLLLDQLHQQQQQQQQQQQDFRYAVPGVRALGPAFEKPLQLD
ncbi:involucrin-like [Schistocerca nitens]|uniref:involucrin-like n=1 Tax=Schistocerca nitens TaxID=7011 RepID=UPI0021193A15|nr:involucrin-like [Schistocerca nitens]